MCFFQWRHYTDILLDNLDTLNFVISMISGERYIIKSVFCRYWCSLVKEGLWFLKDLDLLTTWYHLYWHVAAASVQQDCVLSILPIRYVYPAWLAQWLENLTLDIWLFGSISLCGTVADAFNERGCLSTWILLAVFKKQSWVGIDCTAYTVWECTQINSPYFALKVPFWYAWEHISSFHLLPHMSWGIVKTKIQQQQEFFDSYIVKGYYSAYQQKGVCFTNAILTKTVENFCFQL